VSRDRLTHHLQVCCGRQSSMQHLITPPYPLTCILTEGADPGAAVGQLACPPKVPTLVPQLSRQRVPPGPHSLNPSPLSIRKCQNMAKPPSSLPPSGATPLRVSLLLGSFVHSSATINPFDLYVPPSAPAPVYPEEHKFFLLFLPSVSG
jgi:hypothetical protein